MLNKKREELVDIIEDVQSQARIPWGSDFRKKLADHLIKNDVERVIKCENCKYGRPVDNKKYPERYYKSDCVVCECENVVGDESMIYPPEHYCGFGRSK